MLDRISDIVLIFRFDVANLEKNGVGVAIGCNAPRYTSTAAQQFSRR